MTEPRIDTDERSLIEQAMPDPQFTLIEHLVVRRRRTASVPPSTPST